MKTILQKTRERPRRAVLRARRGGFSMTEGLVALALAAIVAGILFPVFGQAVRRGREVRCLGNLRQLGLAVSLYAADQKMELPPGNSDGEEWFKLTSRSWLRNYCGGTEGSAVALLRCPGDQTGPPVSDYRYYYSYTWTAQLLQAYVGGSPAYGRAAVKLQDVRKKILFADAITHAEAPQAVPKYPASVTPQNANDRISRRHRDGANALFGDGAARWLPWQEAVKPERFQRD